MRFLPSPWRHLLALLAGALYSFGFAPFGYWPLPVLSCAVLALLLTGLTPRQVFRYCFSYGLGLFAVGVSWVYISIHTHGGESVAISLLLTGLFVLLLTAVFALAFCLFGYLRRTGATGQLAAFPAVWVLVEWFRGWVFTGFPWIYLGNSFSDTWLVGWAPLGGVLLLSLLGAFSGVSLVCLFILKGHYRILPLSLAAAIWLGGGALSTVQWTTKASEPLSLAMVQPALAPSVKWSSSRLYDILVQLQRQSSGLWDKDFLIWPESAIPTPPQDVQPYMDYLDNMARETGTTMITGIPLEINNRYYNSVILLGSEQGKYAKRHLVPFGEYLPLDSLLRGIIAFFDRPMSSFSAGSADQPLLKAKGITIATAICYEIIFQDLVAKSARNADLILTLSNDIWFGDSIAPHQHLQMARMRAIENGKPVVRATNDGISAVINHRGQITMRMPQFVATTGTGEVTPYRGQTPFSQTGSWPVVVCSLLIALLIFVHSRKKRSELDN